MAERDVISVVIPAHNEEAGIGDCLSTMLRDAQPDEFDVTVVCNGCTDRTAEIAGSFGPPVRVLSSPVASKIAALNLGDEKAAGFPRFYVDGDVKIDTAGMRRLAGALAPGDVLVAVPRIGVDLDRRPWGVRAFFRIWTRLPYFESGMASSGVYALSEAGRARFGPFPDVIADDHYVLTRFSAAERRYVPEATSIIQAPWSLRDVVRVKTRAFLGGRQLEASDHGSATAAGRGSWLGVVARQPRLWVDAPVYLAVNLVAEVRARRRLRRSNFGWERDHSARAGRGSAR